MHPESGGWNFIKVWAGLAGWYCRAGCGRSSHFGDEISLSNPAPYFICQDRPSATTDVSLLRLTGWLISDQRLTYAEKNTLRDVLYHIMKDDRWYSPRLSPKKVFPSKIYFWILIHRMIFACAILTVSGY